MEVVFGIGHRGNESSVFSSTANIHCLDEPSKQGVCVSPVSLTVVGYVQYVTKWGSDLWLLRHRSVK